MKSVPEERVSLSRSSGQEELDYRDAPGSGSAAVLAFLHIAAAGILAYGSYFLLRNSTEAVLASLHLSWQFFLPMGIGLFLYLPTNPLSRVVGLSALWLAVAGVVSVVGAVILAFTLESRQVPEIGAGMMLARLGLSAAAGLAAGWGLRVIFKRLLPKRDPRKD